ncbi:MAG: hypothetical protein LBS60_10020 [Deltaproteobacteria bacterium]|jgi:hypothetical protein|nr:hypothetical protein [Deltaproteobacteria bacterium]
MAAYFAQEVSNLSLRLGVLVFGLLLLSLTLRLDSALAAPKYHAHDAKALKSFDTSKNDPANELNWSSSPVYDQTWTGVAWVDAGNGDYRVEAIDIRSMGLTGELKLNGLTSLTELDARDNALTAVDIANNPALAFLCLWSNKLTSLDVSKNADLESLDVDANKLPFSQLYQLMGIANLKLGSQKGVVPQGLVGRKLAPNKVYDLSSELEFNGVTTVFSLTFNNVAATNGQEYSLSPTGELVFNEPGVYQISMTNAAIHDQGVYETKVATVTTEELNVAP